MHNWRGKHWHCAHLVSSLKCALACTVAGNQRAERYSTLVSAGGRLRRGRADSAEGVGALSGKGAHSILNGNPLVDVRTGAGHADVRLGGLWNRHVWKKDADLFQVTTNLILFRETGVLDRE